MASRIDEDPSTEVSGVLRKLQVSRSGYYAWKKRGTSQQAEHKRRTQEQIKAIYEQSFRNYGAPKITKELHKRDIRISEKTVGIYMRQMGIRAQWVRPRTKTTLHCDYSEKLKNRLDRNFSPERPDEVWCSDITYIPTDEGFVYLTSIMDLYARKIVAWTLTRTMEAEEILRCLEMAKRRREAEKVKIVHSDRGSQYTSERYEAMTQGIQRSYSRKGDPWDNACIESFHDLIKREWLNRVRIKNYEQAYELCFEYIETFYNTIRIHSHCKYESPQNYEMKSIK